MKKGIFFSMDAAMAVILALMVVAVMISTMEVSKLNSNDDVLVYSRIARDVYEIQYQDDSAIIPVWINQNCDDAGLVAVEKAYFYNRTSDQLEEVLVKVCP